MTEVYKTIPPLEGIFDRVDWDVANYEIDSAATWYWIGLGADIKAPTRQYQEMRKPYRRFMSAGHSESARYFNVVVCSIRRQLNGLSGRHD
jgi:hypothetical protein